MKKNTVMLVAITLGFGIYLISRCSLHQFITNYRRENTKSAQAHSIIGRKLINGCEDSPSKYRLQKTTANLTILEAEKMFNSYATEIDIKCKDVKRLGNAGDGGWDICVSEPYRPRPGCLVYSFGINYDFSFDIAVASTYLCNVRCYDPSMTKGEYAALKPGAPMKVRNNVTFYKIGLGGDNENVNVKGIPWVLKTFMTLLKDNDETNNIIDVLKIDIEYAEWPGLATMFEEESLKNVKQLVIEIHSPELFSFRFHPAGVRNYMNMYNTLTQLQVLGFRKYFLHHNKVCKQMSRSTKQQIESCFELSYLNINFLKNTMKEEFIQ